MPRVGEWLTHGELVVLVLLVETEGEAEDVGVAMGRGPGIFSRVKYFLDNSGDGFSGDRKWNRKNPSADSSQVGYYA